MPFSERVTTERLILRRTRAADAPAVFAYASDYETTKNMEWRTHTAIEDAERFLASAEAGWNDGSALTWAITLAGDDTAIGGFAVRPRGHKVDFGYILARPHWGRGLATEAGRAMLPLMFADPQVERVWATTSVDNAASRRVLEKLGLTCEGTLRAWSRRPQLDNEARDAYAYSIIRERSR